MISVTKFNIKNNPIILISTGSLLNLNKYSKKEITNNPKAISAKLSASVLIIISLLDNLFYSLHNVGHGFVKSQNRSPAPLEANTSAPPFTSTFDISLSEKKRSIMFFPDLGLGFTPR